jgi:AmmeMemoRadiSam system protein A
MPPLCSDDRRKLLGLARNALTEAVLHDRVADLPPPEGRLAEAGGAFVTLYYLGRLRGCVGVSGRRLPLGETVVQSAAGAARNDARFAPIGAREVHEVEIEISVLSEARAIAPDAIEAGTHGLLVVRGSHRGLLLPQVAIERCWPARRFLEETCRKAGLEPDAWRHPDTEILAFTAEIFSEREFRQTAPVAAGLGPGRRPAPGGDGGPEGSGPGT